MIELTVKTLDSQNHAFSVEDDLTVAQFKEKIASTVNIPADTQRIIYCGRLLQDESKLVEHDLNGKVVHLVQRPPPSGNDASNPRSDSPILPQTTHRRIRGIEYLGTMRFPGDPNILAQIPTHTLAGSRLNVAKRMLRRAELLLNALENPSNQVAENPTPEEAQEEVTPIFEARVIVPSAAMLPPPDIPIVTPGGSTPGNVSQSVPSEETVQVEALDQDLAQPSTDNDTAYSVSSSPDVVPSSLNSSAENLVSAVEEQPQVAPAEETAPTGSNNTTNQTTENISRTSEMAELLDSLNRVNTRFAPFLEQYHQFMRDDPVVSQENTRTTQAILNRVSEILHYLGHAYHSLSDIIVRARTPAPRPLLCRPILIQHSAIVQAGIPIQVEAQINLSSDRNPNTMPQPQAASTPLSNPPTTTTTTSASAPTMPPQAQPQRLGGFTFMPGASVRVETFHLPVSGANPNQNNNNNNRDMPFMRMRSPVDVLSEAAAAAYAAHNMTPPPNLITHAATAPTNEASIDETTLAQTIIARIADNLAGSIGVAGGNLTRTPSNATEQAPSNSNPNVEFFMEVTPESITIDSLEGAFVAGGNQHNDVLNGSLNSPELIQSIMQMAGQLINRGTHSGTINIPPQAPSSTAETPASDPQSTTSTNGAARTTPFQNSQARGNTQTQPTTSTQTRSTARPHVHFSQHAMEGFDPFLPCNSHHVSSRRRNIHQVNGQQASNQNQTSSADAAGSGLPRQGDQNAPFYRYMRNLISNVRTAAYGVGSEPRSRSNGARNGTSTGSQTSNPNAVPPAPAWMATLQNMNLSDNPQTIAQLLQQLPGDSYVEGESIFTDLVMLLSRNLTIGDVIHLNAGRLESLARIRGQLNSFFMERILDGSASSASIDRGVDKLITEMQPFLDNLALLQTRDDIDIVKSVQTLLRARLPNIIRLVTSRSPNSLKLVIDQIRITSKHLCALAIRASQNGRAGVEEVFDAIVTRYMQGIPRDIQQWTLLTSRAQFSTLVSNLDVPESILYPYIVTRDVVSNSSQDVAGAPVLPIDLDEPMQVEEEDELLEAGGSTVELPEPQINLTVDTIEPLPTVVLGSESWHNQVPVDWVPIITRDTQRQRKQNSQPPFSNAYLSGMPSKRRKIVSSSKIQGSLPQVITEGVRRAVSVTGLTGVASTDSVAQAAGNDLSIQAAYRELLRSTVQSELRENDDFTPERFPNASNYFNNHQQ